MSKEGKTPKFIKKKRKLGILGIVLLAVSVFVVIIFISSGVKIMQLTLEEAEAKKINEELENKKADLEQELENINSDEYIEKYARNKLKLIRPNELLFVFSDGWSKNKNSDSSETDESETESGETSPENADSEDSEDNGENNENNDNGEDE